MKTLLIIKPDGTDILDIIFNILKAHNITLCAVKTKLILPEVASQLYEEHREKYFFKGLIKYMTTAPCILLKIKGSEEDIANAKKEVRALIKEKINLPEINDETFIKEFSSTFDGIHIPDPQRSKNELSLFFKKDKPVLRKLEETEKKEIVELKLSSKLGQ